MDKNGKSKALHITLVLIVFSVTGLTVARLGALLAVAVGLEKYSVGYWLFWVFALLPIYPFILLAYAFLFGKFNYFLNHQRRFYRRIGRLFNKKKRDD